MHRHQFRRDSEGVFVRSLGRRLREKSACRASMNMCSDPRCPHEKPGMGTHLEFTARSSQLVRDPVRRKGER